MIDITLDLNKLENALKNLNLTYPKDLLQIFAHKEFRRIYTAIDYLKDEDNQKFFFNNYDTETFEVMIEYIAIMTMSLCDIFAEAIINILKIEELKNKKIYLFKLKENLAKNMIINS